MKVTTTPRDCDKVNQIVQIMQEYLGPVMNLARIKLLAFVLHALCVVQILICYNRPEAAMATYRQRWQIETCFRAMKSFGFNIEDTHLRDIERIARLMAMVCVALVWAYLVGEHMNVKTIRILKHGKRAKSLVKYGLEEIANVLLRPLYKPKSDVFKFLSCT